MKRIWKLLIIQLLICLWASSIHSWDWESLLPSSSRSNAQISNQNYPDDPIQRWVAKSWGDEIPRMRDDLIRRKNNGEGAFERHLRAWTSWDNWKIDFEYKSKQENDPY